MYFPLSSDYIKYLNDHEFTGINYDQWKDKKMRQDLEKCKKNSKRNKHISTYYKYYN